MPFAGLTKKQTSWNSPRILLAMLHPGIDRVCLDQSQFYVPKTIKWSKNFFAHGQILKMWQHELWPIKHHMLKHKSKPPDSANVTNNTAKSGIIETHSLKMRYSQLLQYIFPQNWCPQPWGLCLNLCDLQHDIKLLFFL